MKPKKKSFWLSYDLGLKGNYQALFEFLDNHEAIECGNGLAYFTYGNKDGLDSDKLVERLKTELTEIISPTANDRIYAIWLSDTDLVKKACGRFLFGKRKSTPWTGYGNKNNNDKTNDEAI